MIGFALTQLAAISLGLVLYHASKLPDSRPATRIAFAFAAGHGFLTLLTLGLGVTGIPLWIAPVATLLPTAIYAARHRGLGITFPGMRALNPGRDPVAWAAVLLLFGFGAVALLQALAPPAAKDEVMYQLAVAKWYRLEQAVVFVPNNWPFHFPQLVNLSFLQALSLGGEISAKLHVFLLWVASLLAAGTLAPRGSRLLAACAFAAIPIVAAHSGLCLVDIGTALFGMLALAAVLRCRSEPSSADQNRWAIAAGVMAGFAAGTKFTGLFVPAALVPLLLFGGGSRRIPAFLAVTFLTGFPFYLVHWIQAGNPVYPFFPGIFGGRDLDPELTRLVMAKRYAGEGGIVATLVRVVRGPIELTFSPKTGLSLLGPAFLAYLPLALWSGADRRDVRRAVAFVALFLLMWLFVSPMVRLALPAWGALCGLVAAAAGSPRWSRHRLLVAVPLLAWCLLSLCIMGRWLLVNGTFSYHLGGTGRTEYLTSRLDETFGGGPDFRDLEKANRLMQSPASRVLTNVQFLYYVDGRHEDIREILSREGPAADAGDAAWAGFADRILGYARDRDIHYLLLDLTMPPDHPLRRLLEAFEEKEALAPLHISDTIALFDLR